MLHYQPKKSKKNGFSLIELLVVVGIIGVLAAIAIPAYNQYRKDATQGAFFSTASNIGRAFHACIAMKKFSDCDSYVEIGIDCNQCLDIQNSQISAPNLCVDMQEEIGGEQYKSCVNVNSSTGKTVVTFNQKSCYKESNDTTGSCNDTAFQANCDSLIVPVVECTTVADCTAIGANYCEDVNGKCNGAICS